MSIFSNRAADTADEAAAYVRAIVGLLDGREPAQVLRETPEWLSQVVRPLSLPELTTPEAPDKWSINQVVQHLADSELVWGWRLRRALSEDRPRIVSFDQDLWADRLGYADADPQQGLLVFQHLRQANLRLLEHAGPAAVHRTIVHESRGEETISFSLQLYAGHDLAHRRQIARILDHLKIGPARLAHDSGVQWELRDVLPGLWVWRMTHRDWKPGEGWDPVVTSTCVESGSEILLLDPIAPPAHASDIWDRFATASPTGVIVLKPDHVRDVDTFVRRFDIPAYGPDRFQRDQVPHTHLEPVWPGSQLPGGLVALYDGRGRNETPLWLPEQRAVVFADALTAPEGELRVWGTPWHEERVLPALRALLDLPFELVIVSHGEPVHTRAEFERALGRRPWPD